MRTLLLVAMAGVLLAGCADQPKKEEPGAAVEERKVTEGKADESATATGRGGEAGPAVRPLPAPGAGKNVPPSDPNNILSRRSIYFDYDSNVVKEEFRPLVEAHAKFMLATPGAKIILQGNTDERGSREYNLSLGQRRADAVKKMMLLLGVPEARIETVSFGEEKPKELGSNEEAWARNRRADIVYVGE